MQFNEDLIKEYLINLESTNEDRRFFRGRDIYIYKPEKRKNKDSDPTAEFRRAADIKKDAAEREREEQELIRTENTYGSGLLKHAGFEYIENGKLLDLQNFKTKQWGYMVTADGRVLISPDIQFASEPALREFSRLYRVNPDTIGILKQERSTFNIIPGFLSGYTFTKGLYKQQTAAILKTCKILISKYPQFHLAKDFAKFVADVNKRYDKFKSDQPSFNYNKWREGIYKNIDWQNDHPDKKQFIQYQGSNAFGHQGTKAVLSPGVEDELRQKAVKDRLAGNIPANKGADDINIYKQAREYTIWARDKGVINKLQAAKVLAALDKCWAKRDIRNIERLFKTVRLVVSKSDKV